NEWLLEKITEVGCYEIIPVQSIRSEKTKYNEARWESILIAAMLQSQQCFLPQLQTLTSFKNLMQQTTAAQQLIAHCETESSKMSLHTSIQKGKDLRMLIGPEGDFTSEEIQLALSSGYQPVSLGPNRLRTETAGLYSCTVFNALNYE